MKYLIAAVALLLSTNVLAQDSAPVLPPGCYVATGSTECFDLIWSMPNIEAMSTSDVYNNYGSMMGNFLYEFYFSQNDRAECFADVSRRVEATFKSDQKNAKYKRTQIALVKKLRKACGSKCKRIK